MVYNVNYFIKKFEAIPEEKWTTGAFEDECGCKCALGHCGYTESGLESQEGIELTRLLKHRAAAINDGGQPKYDQPTPKQRILAALNDVKNETF